MPGPGQAPERCPAAAGAPAAAPGMRALRGARAALALLLAAALGPGPARPHPQCLDFKPPFRPPGGLAFCRRYGAFGCCEPRRDRALLQRFYRLSAHLDGHTYAACAGHLQELLCQVRGSCSAPGGCGCTGGFWHAGGFRWAEPPGA